MTDVAEDVASVHTQGARYLETKHFKLFAESCLEAGVAKDLVDEMQTYVTKHADSDKDGKVDKKEFSEFLRKNEKFGVEVYTPSLSLLILLLLLPPSLFLVLSSTSSTYPHPPTRNSKRLLA